MFNSGVIFSSFLPYVFLDLNFVPENILDPTLQIETQNGVVQGTIKKHVDKDMIYYGYEGIPFALPPVNDLRFKAPQPPKNWSEVLRATAVPISCIQTMLVKSNFFSEDCLYLSVYTTVNMAEENEGQELLPVMFYIYGGAFNYGFCSHIMYGPDYLLENGVIVVCANYRLGVFGFLSTEDMASPGNYGIKDQIAALKWTRDNIAKFGGDPKKITIFGESAGAGGVHILLLDSNTNGLIQGAIAESGTAIAVWCLDRNPRRIAFQLGKYSGFFFGNSYELVNHLRNLSADALAAISTMAVSESLLSYKFGNPPFVPTIEPKHDGAVITGHNHELLRTGRFNRVPFIVGANSEEITIVQDGINILSYAASLVNPEAYVPSSLNIPPFSFRLPELAEKIQNFYNNSAQTKEEALIHYLTNHFYHRPGREAAKQMSKFSRVYFYKFAYEGWNLGRKGIIPLERSYKGVGHTEELWYIWSRKDLRQANETDNRVRNQMLRMWTNFAKTGNPTPEKDSLLDNTVWLPVTDEFVYLEISNKLEVKKNMRQTRMQFWDDIFEKYGFPPYYTY